MLNKTKNMFMSLCRNLWTHIKQLKNNFHIKSNKDNQQGWLLRLNKLFVHLQTLKLNDLGYYKTSEIMYKVNNSMLPEGVQRMFQSQANRYEPIDFPLYTKAEVWINVKQRWILLALPLNPFVSDMQVNCLANNWHCRSM